MLKNGLRVSAGGNDRTLTSSDQNSFPGVKVSGNQERKNIDRKYPFGAPRAFSGSFWP